MARPAVVKAPSSWERLYERRFAPAGAYRARVWRILCDDFFARFVPPEGAVLDLGTGWGHFINHVRAAARYALDASAGARERLAPGVEFLHQDSAAPWPLADGALDTVFTSNFLEHLPDKQDVEATVAEAFRCLRPGGRIVCMGPNARHVGGAYWSFWDHQIPITDASCVELLQLCGFEVESAVARFLPYTMARRGNLPPVLLRLYLRWPWAWRLFGKQFLVVGRKPGAEHGDLP